MHEWALAESVILAVSEEAKRENLKVITRVKVVIGELQQIDMDIFKFALENILQSSGLSLDMKKINVEIDKCILKCKACANEWSFSEALKNLTKDESESIHFIPEVAHIYMRCPECGSPDFEIVKGRGVWIDYIEGER